MNAKVLILRRNRKHIPPDIMIKLYKAFILPHFEYASPLFTGLSKGLSAKLELTNAFALRALLNHSNLIAYEELLKIALIKSLEHRRIEQALIFVYKSIYDQAPIYMEEIVTTVTAYGAICFYFLIPIHYRPLSVYVDYVNYFLVIFMSHLHLNEPSLICDIWVNKIT